MRVAPATKALSQPELPGTVLGVLAYGGIKWLSLAKVTFDFQEMNCFAFALGSVGAAFVLLL